MKKLSLLIIFSILAFVAKSQPLSGTKTIGIASDYPDIQTAVSALLTNGISNNVEFNIKTSATAYTVGNLNIATFTGHGLFSVTFQAESGNSNDVKIENIGSDLYIFHCYGSHNIQFKNLSLKSNSTTWSNIFMLDYDADNITIENCKLKGNYNGSFESQYSLIYVDDVIASNNSNCDNLIVRNCLLDGGKAGITVKGNSSGAGNYRNSGIIIEKDSIVNQKQAGIHLEYSTAFNIKENYIKPTIIVSPTSMYEGISLAYCDGLYSVESNLITVSGANPVGNLHGIFVEFSNHATLTTALNCGVLKNNMVHLNGGSPGSDAIGIVIQDCNYTKLFHNTIRTTADGYEDYCIKFNSSSNIIFKNNLLQVGTIPLIINKDGSSTLTSDYNVYFGFNGMGTNDNGSSSFPSSLADWKLATGLDANSIYKQVTFFGDYSTLELSAESVADHDIRVPLLPSVTQDIYGKPRQTLTCAGAYERYGPLSGTYFINNTAPTPLPARTFKNFNKAIQALASGVNGATEFKVNNGDVYYENFTVPNIEGSSLANNITFTSVGLQTAILSYNANVANVNYIAKLDSAAFITFNNLAFYHRPIIALGTCVKILNGAKFINFTNNVFYGNQNPSSPPGTGEIINVSSENTNPHTIKFENNTLNDGEVGIKINSMNTPMQNIVIKNNTINNSGKIAVQLQNVVNIIVENNRINKTISNMTYVDFYGINCDYCEGNSKINSNFIDVSAASSTGYKNTGIYVQSINPTTYTTLLNMGEITNNMVRVMNASSYESSCLSLNSTGFKKVLHNTFINTSASSVNANAVYVSNLADTVDIQNNIFQSFGSGNGMLFSTPADINKLRQFDYNNFNASIGNLLQVNLATANNISQIISLSNSKNTNSTIDTVICVSPTTSPADLHLSGASITNSTLKGISIPGFLIDIDGDSRSATTAFKGADEGCQTPLALAPTAVSTHVACNGLPLATATKHYGGQLKWYTTASGGTSTLFPNQTLVGTYTVWVSEKQGNCETPRTAITIINKPGAEITVIATINSNTILNGKLFLFKQNSTNNRMDTIRVENTPTSTYTFTDLYPGNYLIYFKPNKMSYPNVPGRFNGDVLFWTNAPLLSIGCSSTNTFTINATTMATTTGPGTISGKVQKGINFGKTNTVGDPIPGVDISLEQNPGGIMLAQTETNSNGEYSFSNIPLNDYRVKVNIPGTPHTAYYDVTINNETPIKADLIYVVDSTEIYPLSDNVNIKGIASKISFKIIPNPTNNSAIIDLPSDWKTNHETLQITITDISGKTVSNFSAYSDDKIILKRDNLKNGIYFVKLSNNKQSLFSKLILVD